MQENKRTLRSPNDPFDQQQEDVSAFWGGLDQQQQDISSFLNPQVNEVSQKPLGRSREEIPVYPPVSLHSDTRVNDILLDNGRRAGLIMLEPNAEFVDKDTLQKPEGD